MAMYRILDGATVYILDGVMEGSFSFKGKATRKPIQDGSLVSDHYVLEPIGISFSGKITDVKKFSKGKGFENSQNLPSVLDTVTEWKALQESGKPFTVEVAPSSGTTFTNCVFDEVQFSNDSATGNFMDEFYAFNVRATISQIKPSKRVTLSVDPDTGTLGESTSNMKTGSGANAKPDEKDRERALDAIIKNLEDVEIPKTQEIINRT